MNFFSCHTIPGTADDSLATASAALAAADKLAIWCGLRRDTTAIGIIAELSNNFNNNAGSFSFVGQTGDTFNPGSHTTTATNTGYASYLSSVKTVPGTYTVSAEWNLGGSTRDTEIISCYVNGASDKATTSGVYTDVNVNFGTYPLYIGRRGGTSLTFNGRLYGLIIRGAASTGTMFADANTWVNGKTGAY